MTWDIFVMFVIPALAVFGGSLALSYFVSGMSQKCDSAYLDQLARLRIQCDMMQHKRPVSKPVISRTGDITPTRKELPASREVSKPVISRTDDITLAILKIASEEPQTVRAIKSVLGQSREHISRTVKKMSEQGLLNRIEGRPYKYIITSAGQERLKREDAS